jgi:hypothetical protein
VAKDFVSLLQENITPDSGRDMLKNQQLTVSRSDILRIVVGIVSLSEVLRRYSESLPEIALSSWSTKGPVRPEQASIEHKRPIVTNSMFMTGARENT